MKMKKFEIGIIGGGIAALVAANSALEAGYKTVLFEGNALGGKAFNGGDLYLNKFVQEVKSKEVCRISDLHNLFIQSDQMKEQYLNKLFPFISSHENFTFINHNAWVLDKNTIEANGVKYNCKYIIIATGIKANQVDIKGLDDSIEKMITLSATELRKISKNAKKIAVLGGGRIAFELAMLLCDFGIETHILSRGECLSHLDREVKDVFLKTIKNDLLHINAYARINSISDGTIYYNDKQETFDNIIMAFGYHFDDAQAKALDLNINENGIIVNDYMQTSQKNIYAIGDVNMHSKFSNAAVKEAIIAINHIKGIRTVYKSHFIYRILGRKEYAYLGLSEEAIIKSNIKYKKLVINEDDILENYNQIKFVKILIDDVTREILGLYVVANEASSVINSILLLLEENIEDKVNARFPFFTNVHFVTQTIKAFFKELDNIAINQYYKPFYQIKVDKDKKIVGAESLARFKKGEEFLSPAYFIKNFEANGLIIYLDLKVIEEGFKLLKELEELDLIDSKFKLAINISSLTIEMLEYGKIIQLLKKYNVRNENIIFEITERKTYEDEKSYADKLAKFKSLDLSLSMDDFSVGNSSLSLYGDIDFNEVKLDMGLLPRNENDHLKQIIYKELVSILRKKDNLIASEGIENEYQFNFAKDLGVDSFQGYYFSKPLSKDEFIDLLKKSKNK